MSSGSSCMSTDLSFSSIRLGVTDLGMTTIPRWRAKEIQICMKSREGGCGVCVCVCVCAYMYT